MVLTANSLLYEAFGLKLASSLPLPEVRMSTGRSDLADVTIEEDERLPILAREAQVPQRSFYARPGLVMFQVPDTGIFCMEAGESIRYFPFPGAMMDKLRLYLLGTCMAVVLLQRQILPLHGSAIKLNGKVYALVGESGAGKSTLASVLVRRGYELLTDDIAAVTLAPDGTPMVHPSYPQQKLWEQSLQQFNMDAGRYQPLFERETKFAVPVAERFCPEAAPLAGIFELVKSGGDEVRLQALPSLGRLEAIYRHTFRHVLIAPMELQNWHFGQSARIAGRIGMYQINRPGTGFTAEAMADAILYIVNREADI